MLPASSYINVPMHKRGRFPNDANVDGMAKKRHALATRSNNNLAVPPFFYSFDYGMAHCKLLLARVCPSSDSVPMQSSCLTRRPISRTVSSRLKRLADQAVPTMDHLARTRTSSLTSSSRTLPALIAQRPVSLLCQSVFRKSRD